MHQLMTSDRKACKTSIEESFIDEYIIFFFTVMVAPAPYGAMKQEGGVRSPG